ncbi:MAG: TldD/PmbA family protein [Acidobacteria bacterium]|nr:TldD/PmbA family protein [Acidobacteriota bacterium]
MAVLSEKRARELSKTILGFAEVPEVEVRIRQFDHGFLRFARNEATTAGDTTETEVAVTAWKGKRRATVSGGFDLAENLDKAGLQKLVADAEELAAISPEDREYMPLPGPQEYPEVDAFDEATAAAGPLERARKIKDAIAYAREKKVSAAGFLDQRAGVSVIANSAELFGYFPSTNISYSVTARTPDGTGSGYHASSSNRLAGMDLREATTLATNKAVASRNPAELAPGDYPAILEPQAVADLLDTISWDMRSAEEGRSVFAAPEGKTRLGERMFSESVQLRVDPAHPYAPAPPLGPGGLPARKADFIRDGKLVQLSSSRYWADKTKRVPGPFAVNLILGGSDRSLADLVRATQRGVLVTRFWYIRTVDSQQALMTGLTRDGTFWVEDGEIRHPVKNFRFNESMVRVLGLAEGLAQQRRIENLLVPALKTSSFRFTSLSDAV